MNNIKQALESAIEAMLSMEATIARNLGVSISDDEANAVLECKATLAELDKCEPQQQWVGLSDSDVMEITWDLEDTDDLDIFTSDFARAIEAKLKELNT